MKLRWALLIMILAVGWTLPALATPQIVIGDPGCNTGGPFTGGLQIATGNSFSITPVNGGGFFGICNESGHAWTNVDISFTSSTLTVDQIQCTTANGVFNNPCTITKNGNQFDLLFSGGTGIPASCEEEDAPTEPGGNLANFCLMTVNLNTNASTTTTAGDWDSIVLTGRVNVPEPATFALLGSGLAGLWQYRRRRK